MKKTIFTALAVLTALGFTACSEKNDSCNAGKCGSADKEVLYSGILPAADAQGTLYVLKLEFEKDKNHTEGDFTLVETGLASDTLSTSGLKEVATGYSAGDFRKESKVVDGATVDYIRLIPDVKDGLGAASAESTYFIVNEDGSLTMVSADLQKSEVPGLNYTLTVVK